jgi:FAD/FMN-containing dehydrogenase
VTLVRWAATTGTPLVPRGSGTSMAGGAVGAGVVVDLGQLGDMSAVDVANRRITVGPGVTRGAVERAAAAAGLRFPVDPSSGAYCTVGGMASTNAAGAHTLKYGATRPWVQAVECVFADGSRAWLRRGEPAPTEVPAVARALAALPGWRDAAGRGLPARPGVRKDTSGYAVNEFVESGELVDLLVGSEGTLALFVGLELRLAPRAVATSSLLAAFPALEQATDAAGRARELGASACELLDRTFLEVAASGGATGVPPGSEAVLLAEVEGDTHDAAAALAGRVADVFRAAGATEVRLALDAATETVLWELRHRASPTIARLHPHLRSLQFIEDGAVPPAQLPAYVRGVREALARHGVRGVIFGHAGDAHVHVNPLLDVGEPAWREQVAGILDDVTALTQRLGGTMAGEHGDGRLRTPLLPRLRGPDTMALYAEVKGAFDPQGILNPGVKVPLPGQQPLGAIKYDPALPPLPEPARRVLDHVTRERAYAAHRLDLLARAEALDAPVEAAPVAEDVEGETREE